TAAISTGTPATRNESRDGLKPRPTRRVRRSRASTAGVGALGAGWRWWRARGAGSHGAGPPERCGPLGGQFRSVMTDPLFRLLVGRMRCASRRLRVVDIRITVTEVMDGGAARQAGGVSDHRFDEPLPATASAPAIDGPDGSVDVLD